MQKCEWLLLSCFNADYITVVAQLTFFGVFREYTYLEFWWTDFEM